MEIKNCSEVCTDVNGNTKALTSKFKNYCFTSFKTEEPKFLDNMRYLAYGLEICPSTGKEHWQGFVSYKNGRSFNAVKKEFNGDHIEIIRGTLEQNKKYCEKEGKFKEWGKLPKQGERNDLNEIAEKIINKEFDELENGGAIIKYHKGITVFKDIVNNMEILKRRNEDFKIWYNELPNNILLNIMDIEAHVNNSNRRQINWIWSEIGNVGKSAFAEKMIVEKNAKVYDTTGRDHIAYAIDVNDKYIIFDLSRSQEDYISYDTFECLLNRRITNKKYESKIKYLNVDKLIVLANFEPDLKKLSYDRWNILKIDNRDLTNMA